MRYGRAVVNMFGKVSKEMSAVGIVEAVPNAYIVIEKFGIKFFDAGFSPFDPIEKVAKGNGLTDEQIDLMINEINGLSRARLFSLSKI